MKTVKEILTENRNSIISAIKWTYQVYSQNEIVEVMKRFLTFCEKNEIAIFEADNAKNTKTRLRDMVCKMKISEKSQLNDNRKWYEIKEDIADNNNLVVNSLTGNFEDINGNVVDINTLNK